MGFDFSRGLSRAWCEAKVVQDAGRGKANLATGNLHNDPGRPSQARRNTIDRSSSKAQYGSGSAVSARTRRTFVAVSGGGIEQPR